MRYIITKPVPGGYGYFNIADTQSEIMPNFAVVTISAEVRGAEGIIFGVCDFLNRRGDVDFSVPARE